MQPLWHTFAILQIIGMWRPVHWLPGWKTKLYDSYTGIVLFLVVTLTLSELIGFMYSFGDIPALVNNSFILLTLLTDCGKIVTILNKRSDIIELTNILQQDPCRPRTDEEFAIQHKFDRTVRSNTLCYATLIGITATALTLTSLVEDIPKRALPYNAWLPFECHESLLGYSIAYSHQIVTFTVGGAVTTSFDALVTGLMLQTCAQLSILKHRFQDMPQMLLGTSRKLHSKNYMDLSIHELERKLLKQCIDHHIQIFKFAETSNDLFSIMIFVQYSSSIMVIGMSVFELSGTKLFSAEFLALLIYVICIAIQIFVYCFYGCEVALESLAVGGAIYGIDWESFSISSKRSLLTIMSRALKPIQFTSGYIITLNLESFNSLLKVSYSAYNVLQTSSE